MSKNNFYITTPIYYPSGQPHMGHAYSSILTDVFARFKRIDNSKVYFLTGTDEHGLKIQKATEKNNLEPLIYCDKISEVFKTFSKKLNWIEPEKIEVHADQQYITSLKPQYYQREQDGKLSKVVDDLQFESRQKARQIVQQNKLPKGSPAPPPSKKPPKRKKIKPAAKKIKPTTKKSEPAVKKATKK